MKPKTHKLIAPGNQPAKIGGSVPGRIFLAYYMYYLPWVVSQMMPIAGVLATVFLFVTLQIFSLSSSLWYLVVSSQAGCGVASELLGYFH